MNNLNLINRAQDDEQRVNQAVDGLAHSAYTLAEKAYNKAYTPGADAVLNYLKKGADLISLQDSFTQKASSYRSFKDAQGLSGKVKAIANNYDAAVAKYGDQASIKAGEGAYYVVKQALNILTGTVISRSKIGRIVQESLATATGLLVRAALKVGEYVLRVLPYAALAASIYFGGAYSVIGLGVLYGASKIAFAATLLGAGTAVISGAQQAQIRNLSNKINTLVQEQRKLHDDIRETANKTEAYARANQEDFAELMKLGEEKEEFFDAEGYPIPKVEEVPAKLELPNPEPVLYLEPKQPTLLEKLREKASDLGSVLQQHKGDIAVGGLVMAAGAAASYLYGPEAMLEAVKKGGAYLATGLARNLLGSQPEYLELPM